MEGAVKCALDTDFVAAEGSEGVGVFAEDVGEFFVFGGVGVFRIDVSAVVGEAEVEEAGFEIAAAGEPPLGHYDLVEESGFEGAGGLEVIFEILEEVLEILRDLADDDGIFGGEAVFERIEPNGGLAFGGFGAGAELSVAAVGGDLFIGRHGLLGLLGRKMLRVGRRLLG
jgi:hypothetical protein